MEHSSCMLGCTNTSIGKNEMRNFVGYEEKRKEKSNVTLAHFVRIRKESSVNTVGFFTKSRNPPTKHLVLSSKPWLPFSKFLFLFSISLSIYTLISPKFHQFSITKPFPIPSIFFISIQFSKTNNKKQKNTEGSSCQRAQLAEPGSWRPASVPSRHSRTKAFAGGITSLNLCNNTARPNSDLTVKLRSSLLPLPPPLLTRSINLEKRR
ncbi:unnamed protein product [Citrullus colocynthis]|uniref:Transmembrane protein n=1 Tax=Citrullus colocynthis TaxID=252529 RepID=A0ABP0YPQ6_9ROSI